MSPEVLTLYEFLDVVNTGSSTSQKVTDRRLWASWQAQMDEKIGGKRPGLVNADETFFLHWNSKADENSVLFLTVMELLLYRPQVQANYDTLFLLPLTQTSNRAVIIKSLCGRY